MKVTAKWFNESEFRRCTPSCSMQDMNPWFMKFLDALREKAGIPLVINSAYRSVAYEKQHSRSGTSAHTKGLAVDIRCNTSQNRMRILRAALELGCTRIGIGETYIHVDLDESLPQNVVWHYY